MTPSTTAGPTSTNRRDELLAMALQAAAVIAFFFPSSYAALHSVGTTDNTTLDSAGYEQRRSVVAVDAPSPKRGDSLLGSIMLSQQAAERNKDAADRRGVAVLLAVPGAYLLGCSSPRRTQSRGLSV